MATIIFTKSRGGFIGLVAFSVYLPSYLKTAHGLTPADAANRMAGFVVVAVIMRPVGGWLSDRLGAVPVLAGDTEATLTERIKEAERAQLVDYVGRMARDGWTVEGRKVSIP